MTKSLLLPAVLVLVINCSVFAQVTETMYKFDVKKLTYPSLDQDRSTLTLGDVLHGTGISRRQRLVVVDGVVPGDGKPDPMKTKVSDILTIRVVEDPFERVLYDPEGAKDVILIDTKGGKQN